MTVALIAASAIAAASAVAAGGPVKGATYKGRLVQKNGSEPVSFKVARDGKHVLQFTTRLGYNGNCGQGGGPSYEVHVPSIGLSHSGAFKTTTLVKLGGFHATLLISARINGRTASGVVEEPKVHCLPPHADAKPYQASFTARVK
jgi:hypothetical protein